AACASRGSSGCRYCGQYDEAAGGDIRSSRRTPCANRSSTHPRKLDVRTVVCEISRVLSYGTRFGNASYLSRARVTHRRGNRVGIALWLLLICAAKHFILAFAAGTE